MTSMAYTYTKPQPLSNYVKEKIKMFQRDFCFNLTETEIATMQSLKSEIAVDRYARQLINQRLK